MRRVTESANTQSPALKQLAQLSFSSICRLKMTNCFKILTTPLKQLPTIDYPSFGINLYLTEKKITVGTRNSNKHKLANQSRYTIYCLCVFTARSTTMWVGSSSICTVVTCSNRQLLDTKRVKGLVCNTFLLNIIYNTFHFYGLIGS